MDLREAIRSKSVTNVEGALRNSAKSELMAKNAANGAGLLMLAVNMDKVLVFEYLASAIKKRVRSRGSRIGCFGRNTAYPRTSAKIERVLPSETAQTGQSSPLLFGMNRIKTNRGLGLLANFKSSIFMPMGAGMQTVASSCSVSHRPLSAACLLRGFA